MNNANGMIGRRLTRREALALLAASGAAWIAGPHRAAGAAGLDAGARPACIARPEQTEGPFFVDEALERSDIRSEPISGLVKPGVPLRLMFRISRMSGATCAPLAGAQVDVWHCDAGGRYSDVDRRGPSARGGFLRGYQRTDAAGSVQFLTVYPGWYRGRAVHVHFKIRTQRGSAAQEFTSQLYFDDALTDRIYALAPYSANGRPSMRNANDFIFRDGGRQLIANAVPDGPGYAAAFDIALA